MNEAFLSFIFCRTSITLSENRIFWIWNYLWIWNKRVTRHDFIPEMQDLAAIPVCLTLLTTKKQTTKFSSANFKKMLSPSYIILRIQRLESKQCRCRWGGSLWAPHQDLRCLQIQLFLSLVLKELMKNSILIIYQHHLSTTYFRIFGFWVGTCHTGFM